MGNLLVGIPIGGQTGGGVRPYFAAGAGLLQTRVEDPDAVFEIDNNDFGINIGGGVFGFKSIGAYLGHHGFSVRIINLAALMLRKWDLDVPGRTGAAAQASASAHARLLSLIANQDRTRRLRLRSHHPPMPTHATPSSTSP